MNIEQFRSERKTMARRYTYFDLKFGFFALINRNSCFISVNVFVIVLNGISEFQRFNIHTVVHCSCLCVQKLLQYRKNSWSVWCGWVKFDINVIKLINTHTYTHTINSGCTQKKNDENGLRSYVTNENGSYSLPIVRCQLAVFVHFIRKLTV